MKTCGQAGDLTAGGSQLFQAVIDVDHDLADVLQAVARVAAAQGVNFLFRDLQHLLRSADALIDHVADLRGRGDECAQQRLVVDDGAVLLDVGGGRRDLEQLRQIIIAVLLIVHAALFHFIENGDRVDLFREVEHRIDGLIDLAVLPQIEILRLQHADDIRHAALINEHGAEHRLLRFQRLRRLPGKQFLIHTVHILPGTSEYLGLISPP